MKTAMIFKDKPCSNCSVFRCLLLLCTVLTLALMYNVGTQYTTKVQKDTTHIMRRYNPKPNVTIENYLLQNLTGQTHLKTNLSIEFHPKQPLTFEHHHKQNSTIGEKKPFYRLDTTPENTIKLPFLKNFKNPCWREQVLRVSKLRCLPYFYMVGAPKAGTSDLHSRLKLHPSVSNKVVKEPHWITRFRFNYKGRYGRLSNYLHYFDRAVREDIVTSKQGDGRYKSIFGDSSCSTLWDNWNLLNDKMRRNTTFPPYTNANIIYNLNPKAKIIIMLRNPTRRLYSDYQSFRKTGKSSWLFHNKVAQSVNKHTECLRENSLRYCVHKGQKQEIRICIGMYYIYVEDYLRVFPKEQIKIIKTEDYSKNISKTMTEVFEFLEIGDPPKEIWTKLIGQKKKNEGKEKYQHAGEMLPETRRLLSQFYKPYNEKLARILGDNFMFDQ